MTQSGDLPPPDPGSAGSPDPFPPASSPLDIGSDWYTPWKPDAPGTLPADAAAGEPATPGAAPGPGAPWGVPGARGAAPTPFGAAPNAAGQPGQLPYGQPGQPPYGQPDQPPYGQPGQPPYGPYGQPGPFGPGFPGMGYGGWRRGMYGPWGGGRPMGAYTRSRAITRTILGAILLAIGIVATVASLNSTGGGAGIVYVPWFLIVLGGLWFLGGLTMLARTSRFR